MHDKSIGKDSIDTRWYPSSLDLNAEQALNCVRSHWQVEKYALGAGYDVHKRRVTYPQGPLVFNVMRKIAMALFKQDETNWLA